MEKSALIKAAAEARKRAYAPYSGFPVGAAVLGENGKIYTGANIENASLSATLCAERAALAAAVADGCLSVKAVAVAAGDAPTPPCGVCRQVLREFGDENVPVCCADAGGAAVMERTLGELLPDAFTGFGGSGAKGTAGKPKADRDKI